MTKGGKTANYLSFDDLGLMIVWGLFLRFFQLHPCHIVEKVYLCIIRNVGGHHSESLPIVSTYATQHSITQKLIIQNLWK